MTFHTQDTIAALATAPGPGGRAIVRLSGPQTAVVIQRIFRSKTSLDLNQRCLLEGEVLFPNLASALPADLYFWPAPRTYTGQVMAELHTLSCKPLVDLLVSELLQAGCRAAQRGEFTLRAFLAGKLDLTRAEAVIGVIEAGDRNELKQALTQLAGGMGRPLQELRDDLLNLLADVEAGLDFADEDIHLVRSEEMLHRLARGLAQVTLLSKQLERRGVSDAPFRVVLVGRPNAGKSSLFNALAGASALVNSRPGTTRDYLIQRLQVGESAIELVDTAGWQAAQNAIDSQGQTLGQEQRGRADLVLLCLEAGLPLLEEEGALLRQESPPVLGVATKSDRGEPWGGFAPTSAVTKVGLDALRARLAERAKNRKHLALAPSLSRCRHHVTACLACLKRAHAMVLYEEPPELLAFELRGAVDQLGEMVGAVYTEDLLDRIFSRFCIGK
jgi:tRNA modification GTPase